MDTKIKIAGIELKNPVMTASGTFGSGMEYAEFVDLNKLGAVVTKGVANVPWEGNPTPRVAEVYGGMLNAIGLQNPGVDVFIERDIPFCSSMIRGLSSMCVGKRWKIIWKQWRNWGIRQQICWKSMYPAQT